MGTDRYGEKNGSYLQPSVQIRTNPYKSVPKKPSRKLSCGVKSDWSDWSDWSDKSDWLDWSDWSDKSDKSDNEAPFLDRAAPATRAACGKQAKRS